MKTDKPVSAVCPLCGKPYSGACLSRTDNQTPICPDCGIRQALESIGVSTEEQEKILSVMHRKFPCNRPVCSVWAFRALAEKLPKVKTSPTQANCVGLGLVATDFPRCLFHCTVFYHRKASLSSVRSTKYTAKISPYVLYI